MANAATGDEGGSRDMRPAGDRAPRADAGAHAGFFSIYKPEQGYWTRMCTAGAIALLILLICTFIWNELKTRTNLDPVAGFPKYRALIVGTLALGSALLAWRYLNKPAIVDFFIGTESEMKKVNWTSRKDLFGSTRVVLVFMLLISLVLFFYDIVFGYLFWLIGILKQGPFG